MKIREAFKKLEGKKFELTYKTLKIYNDDLTLKDDFDSNNIDELFQQFLNKNFVHIYLYENWIYSCDFRFSNVDNKNYVILEEDKNCKKRKKRIGVNNLDEFISILENLEEEYKKAFN